MNANLQDAELMIAMTAEDVEPTVEQPPQPNSPASAVCYMTLDDAPAPPTHDTTRRSAPARHDDAGSVCPVARREEEHDTTPRSEAPSVSDAVNERLLERLHGLDAEPSYFSPQPLRILSSAIPRSNPSTDPSPTTSGGHSSGPLHTPSPALVEPADRPSYQRDLSGTSTASVATVRANSLDDFHASIPPTLRDGPQYPNQSYAALQSQQYPASHAPHILRAKSSRPTHHSGFSASHISTFGLPGDHHRDVMDTGSRTVGNSPASSPGLFSPSGPALRRSQPSDDSISTPWLHYTHRQDFKETHVADVDVDPISGRKLVNHYEVIGELGRGVHGKVKLGRDLNSGQNVAIKIVDRFSKRRRLGKNTSHEDKIKREIAILKKARHPNIVGLLEVIDDPSKKKVYIILEHVKLGEVHWRTEGAKEVCLVEYRRYQRESEGIFDNESAALEDEKIIRLAHQRLERQQRRWAKERRRTGNEPWSLELGGDSEDDFSEDSHSSRASAPRPNRPPSRARYADHHEYSGSQGANMETAFRSSTPTANARSDDNTYLTTGLEGTMYGAYDTEAIRGQTNSLAGSNSSFLADAEDLVPEHFRYVPVMTQQAARETFRDTVLGLEYLHYQNVIHRDIKPANLLVTENHRIKISDFGVSYLGRRRRADDTNGDQSESDAQTVDEAIELAKTVGTPAFYAPELCHTELDTDQPKIGPEIDLWALGVTLFCLIYGRVPFHDHNQWLLMRHITDDEPYISQFRLKPVAETSGSRPSSHGRLSQSMTSSKRAAHDLEYEEVDEDLRNLLLSLLAKNPQDRISIRDIKRHPWLTRDIDNLNSWVEETDPDRSSHGRKIEISNDDIEQAVVPFTSQLLDRFKFGFRKVGEITRSLTRQGSRKRAQSTASGQEVPHGGSANSSSSTISQDGRRPSLGPGMYIYEALSKSRESDHPLSHSVTASPSASERLRYFESPTSRTASPAHSTEIHEHPAPLGLSSRPHLPDRAYSTLSSAASIRTVRQSDLSSRSGAVSPGVPPALPGTPTALDTPGGSNLGGIFGGMSKRVVHNARSNEKMLKPLNEHSRAKSIDRLVGTSDDPHAVPSLALSTAVASGHVDQPDLLKDLSPTLVRGPSPNFADFQYPDPTERASSRQSSVSSVSSRLHKSWAAHNHGLEVGPAVDMPAAHAPYARDTSDERFSRAKDEFVRRRVREENLNRERPRSGTIQRPPSALSQATCPPSPDDETFYRHQKVEDFLNQQRQPSHGTSPISYPIMHSTQPRTLTSSSSEEQFTSMSQSTSNPSIPSVASANSSVPDDCSRIDSFPGMVPAISAESIHLNQFDAPTDDPAGYDGDHAIESEDDEESDEEDFLVMGRKKPTECARSESISNAELARSDIRKEIRARRRSVRSGSNGTVKKIPPPDDSGDASPDT